MKKYYLLINPKGGHKKGFYIFNQIKSIFKNSSIKLTEIETEYAGHAFDLAKSLDYNKFDGICAIGGDGTMYEIINGMLKRIQNEMESDNINVILTGGFSSLISKELKCNHYHEPLLTLHGMRLINEKNNSL